MEIALIPDFCGSPQAKVIFKEIMDTKVFTGFLLAAENLVMGVLPSLIAMDNVMLGVPATVIFIQNVLFEALSSLPCFSDSGLTYPPVRRASSDRRLDVEGLCL